VKNPQLDPLDLTLTVILCYFPNSGTYGCYTESEFIVGYSECLDDEVFPPSTTNFRNWSTVQKEKGSLRALYVRWYL